MADVGILRKLSKLPHEVILDATPAYRAFKGDMRENYVLCEMLGSIVDTAYYRLNGNKAEVDFLVQRGKDIVPIEVKSKINIRARSLAEYRKKYQLSFVVKTSMGSQIGDEEVIHIPLYMISSIEKFFPFSSFDTQ